MISPAGPEFAVWPPKAAAPAALALDEDPEMAEFRAWKAAKQAGKPAERAPEPDHTPDEAPQSDDRAAALKLAEEMNISVDKRWSTQRILDTLETAASGP